MCPLIFTTHQVSSKKGDISCKESKASNCACELVRRSRMNDIYNFLAAFQVGIVTFVCKAIREMDDLKFAAWDD